MVPVDLLLPADSPRSSGIDEAHARLLSEIGAELPPILVQQSSMRVIDGMHRVHAACLLGKSHVAVQFFDGDDHAAFLESVAANVTHGLPLSLEDREVAAKRIIGFYPHWSDRAVARSAGLAGKTVAGLRRRTGEAAAQPAKRIGQDGRLRPINGAAGRRIAGELISARPAASLREIARAADISPATVRDVRNRLARGEDPVPDRQRRSSAAAEERRVRPRYPTTAGVERIDGPALLDNLKRDPSLRYTEAGRSLLRWLDSHLIAQAQYASFIDAIPPHCLPTIARLARQCTSEWKALAEQLESLMQDTA
jgi:hypothetical protein